MDCRLCDQKSKNVMLLDTNTIMGETIIWYILQATGINVQSSELVPREACQICIEMCVKIYWFRRKCVERDKLLHLKYNQPYTPPLTRFEDIVNINEDHKFIVPDFIEKTVMDVKQADFEEESDANSGEVKSESMSIEEHGVKVERPDSPEKETANSNSELSKPDTDETAADDYHNLSTELDETSGPSVSKDVFTTSLKLAPSQNTNYEMDLIKVDKSANVYVCGTCNEVCTTKKKYVLHQKTHFHCTECQAHFPKRQLLNEHKKLHAPVVGYPHAPAFQYQQTEKTESEHVKYLMLNRYVHKTQQETQTDEDMLYKVEVKDNTVVYKSLGKEFEKHRVPVEIRYNCDSLRGSYAVNEGEVTAKDPSFDISGIPVKDIVKCSFKLDEVIDLVNSPVVKKKKLKPLSLKRDTSPDKVNSRKKRLVLE